MKLCLFKISEALVPIFSASTENKGTEFSAWGTEELTSAFSTSAFLTLVLIL